MPQPELAPLESLKRHWLIAGFIIAVIVAGATWKALDQLLVRPRDETISTLEKKLIADTPSAKLRAIRIEGVDLDLDSENRTEQALRIIASSNGIAKVYPTDGWARPNPNLSTDPFMVPEASEYLISFEVFAKDARGVITRFLAQSGLRIAAQRLPASELRVELQEEGSAGRVGGRVKFRID